MRLPLDIILLHIGLDSLWSSICTHSSYSKGWPTLASLLGILDTVSPSLPVDTRITGHPHILNWFVFNFFLLVYRRIKRIYISKWTKICI